MDSSVVKYRIECACGESIEVHPTQAGLTVTCVCQTQIVVPSVRELRRLEPVVPAQAHARPQWQARHGMLTASVVLSAILIGLGFWQLKTAPEELINDKIIADIHKAAGRLSPTESMTQWIILNQGLETIDTRETDEYWRRVAVRRFVLVATWVAAAVAAVAGVILFVMLRPKTA